MRNLLKVTLVVAVAVGLTVAFAPKAKAFHDGGVAYCAGCHTMHNSEDGALVDPDSANGNAWLLKDATPSDTCLLCHATSSSRGVLTGDCAVGGTGWQEHGAGTFVCLAEANLNDSHHGSTVIDGDAAGHNPVAPGNGIAADATLTTAPGGTFPASAMGCSSCHDPHGNQNFRLLYGIGSVQDGLYSFTAPAPAAVKQGSGAESNSNHTAYQGGFSAWCGNCHGDFHSPGGKLVHPSNEAIGGTIATAYNLYNGSSDPIGGAQATAYLSQVPFEDPANTNTSTAGPSATSLVSCVTCHRAHGTSAANAGRWDFRVTFLNDDGFRAFALPNPYDVDQRSLCNKCHVKDAGDAPWEP